MDHEKHGINMGLKICLTVELIRKIVSYDNVPLWIFPPMKALPCENYPLPPPSCPRENSPYENAIPLGKLPPMKSPMKAVQHSILIKTTKVLFDTQKISQKILGLDTFFTEWKKSKNPRKAKIAKWHWLANCTSQGELKLGKTKTIKFGKYVELLNSQWSLHITATGLEPRTT